MEADVVRYVAADKRTYDGGGKDTGLIESHGAATTLIGCQLQQQIEVCQVIACPQKTAKSVVDSDLPGRSEERP